MSNTLSLLNRLQGQSENTFTFGDVIDGVEYKFRVKKRALLSISQLTYQTETIGYLKEYHSHVPGIMQLDSSQDGTAKFIQDLTMQYDEIGHMLRIKFIKSILMGATEESVTNYAKALLSKTPDYTIEEIVLELYVMIAQEVGKSLSN